MKEIERILEHLECVYASLRAGQPENVATLMRYCEPHRHYHTLTHLREGADLLDEVVGLSEASMGLYFAWLYHDAVYDTRASNNEQESARLATSVIMACRWPMEFASEVYNLIIATKSHQPVTLAQAFMVDVDLAILGATTPRFEEYEQGIRSEYSWVPEDIYRVKRAEILEGFLNRPEIYHTMHFRQRFELVANYNLGGSIARLRK